MANPTGPDFDRHSGTYRGDVQRSIGFIGQDHDFFVRNKVDHLLRVVRRHLGEPRDLRILDVGCGVGLTDSHLIGRFGQVHGVDVSGEAIEVAARQNPSATFRVYDGERLPFEAGSFDVTFAIGVLHHVEPPLRGGFVGEMRRVTAPGGVVIAFEHNPFNPLSRMAVNRCDFDVGVVLLSKRTAKGLFLARGLSVTEEAYILFSPWSFPGSRRLEALGRRVPLGAQYFVAGRTPPARSPA